MNYLLTSILLFCCALFANSQSLTYPLFEKNAALEKTLVDAIEDRYRNDIKLLSGSNKKEITAIYKERAELVKELVSQKEILTDAAATDYLKAVTQKIYTANSSISNSNLRIYFSRSYVPNAYSMGEGTIVFNIGLFSKLDNEAQMAFVLCHELAHYFLNHGNYSINRYVETLYGEDFQKQLKQIQKNEFEKNAQLEKLVIGLSFRHRRHSREFEEAADSMALSLMKNTGYDISEIISTLGILNSLDKKTDDNKLTIEKLFDFPAYPFKKRWISSSSLAFTESNEEKDKRKQVEDSLKTHPDCSRRIEVLETEIKAVRKSDSKKFIVSETSFRKLQSLFELEALEYGLESGNVSKSFYLTLKKLALEPGNAYLTGLAGRCFIKMYKAQQEHSLGKITDLPNPKFDDDYNLLLKFLQNVRLPELAAIQYHFLQSIHETGKTNEEFLDALIKSKEYFEKPEEKKEWIAYYYSKFPNHKYNF